MRGDPVTVSEIPHPRRLPRPLPYVESEEWFACGPPPAGADQGWKLYVPLTLANAREMVELLAPLLHGFGLHFKYIKNLKLLRKLNAGMFGYTQIGKCFVIYMPEPDGDVIAALKEALAPFRDQCPAVPCARPFGDDLPLYYRYGAYRGSRLVLGGAAVEDDRKDAGAVPPGVDDRLAPFTTPVPDNPEIRSFLLRYPVFQALTQEGKCGIFLGMNLDSESFQEVVLKVGYHRGQVQPDGSDGCTFLRRELAFYRELDRRGLAGSAPRLIDALDIPRKVILVLEFVPGTSLLSRKLAGDLTIPLLERSWSTIGRLHAHGL